MLKHPQWRVGLGLWIDTFNKKDLALKSYDDIKNTWLGASGWNTDRVPGRRLKNEDDSYEAVFDLYIFDIHNNGCRLLSKIKDNVIYVRDILSHSEYDKWCKNNIRQGKQENLVHMVPRSNTQSFGGLFSHLNSAFLAYSDSAGTLMKYASTSIKSEDEVLERAEVMDQLMDMAKHENDIVFIFVNAIADRIEEFEDTMEMPDIPVPERLRGLMEIKKIKQSDLKSIATQSVISEILNGKREVNLKQAKGFSEYFNLPIENFIQSIFIQAVLLLKLVKGFSDTLQQLKTI